MQVIIYGREHCPNCAKTTLLCRMKSIDFSYRTVGTDISVEELSAKVGHAIVSLPQIFLDHDGAVTYVGGYDALRAAV